MPEEENVNQADESTSVQEETQEQELEIDPTLLEESEEGNRIVIDDNEVDYEEVVQAWKDKRDDDAWKARNDAKSKEIAAKKRQLEEEREAFNRQRQEFETLARGMYQQEQHQQPISQNDNFQLSEEDLEDMTPTEKAMYLEMQENRKWREEQQKRYEADRFNADVQERHRKMRETYGDYDPQLVERQIIEGYDPFESVYLANRYKALMNGEKDSILNIIPKDTIEQIKKEVRTQLIEDAKKKEAARKKLATTVPDTGKSLSKVPSKPAKDWHDVNTRVVGKLRDEGISLLD